jgi:hypothetical protein
VDDMVDSSYDDDKVVDLQTTLGTRALMAWKKQG